VTHGCISPLSLHAVEAFASRVRQWGRRGRRRVVDGDLPQSREEANTFVRANPDGLQLLWSVIRSASRGLDEFDAALADARRAEDTVGAWLAEAERQPTATDVDDYAVVQARRQLLAETTAYRSARIALAGAIEAASEPFSALVTHVGRAVEVALLFDREVKRRGVGFATLKKRDGSTSRQSGARATSTSTSRRSGSRDSVGGSACLGSESERQGSPDLRRTGPHDARGTTKTRSGDRPRRRPIASKRS